MQKYMTFYIHKMYKRVNAICVEFSHQGGMTMHSLITVDKARKEIEWLQNYIELVENYQADTIEKLILKEYAYLGSAQKVAKELNSRNVKINNRDVLYQDVTAIIKSKATDDLHKIIKSGFNLRYKNKETKKSRNFLFVE